MPWARIDDHYFNNPKTIDAGKDGKLMHLASIVYACGHRTDGLIRESALPLLGLYCEIATLAKVRKVADRLVELNLWELDPDGQGWLIHDFAEFQPAGGVSRTASIANSVNGRKGGIKSGESRRAQRNASEADEAK